MDECECLDHLLARFRRRTYNEGPHRPETGLLAGRDGPASILDGDRPFFEIPQHALRAGFKTERNLYAPGLLHKR